MKWRYVVVIYFLLILTACDEGSSPGNKESNAEFINVNEIDRTTYLIFKLEDGTYMNYYLEYNKRGLAKALKEGELYNVKYMSSKFSGQSRYVVYEIELVKEEE